jgi:hypothetical protein
MRHRLAWSLALLLAFVASVTGLTLATQADAAAYRSPVAVTASMQVPVIRDASVGCVTQRTLLSYRLAVPEHQRAGNPTLTVEGWFDGGWRPAPVLRMLNGGVLVQGTYGRWRLSTSHMLGSIAYLTTGPAAGPFSDQCVPSVDQYGVPK